MTVTSAATAPGPAAALEAAAALTPHIRDSAAEAERLRTMPPDLADRIEGEIDRRGVRACAEQGQPRPVRRA